MKFKHYLETISGISIYPLISLVLFSILFLAAIIYAVSCKRTAIDEMKEIPFDND